jgi:hypothetical protein
MVRYLSRCGSVAKTRAVPFVACENEAYSYTGGQPQILFFAKLIERKNVSALRAGDQP